MSRTERGGALGTLLAVLTSLLVLLLVLEGGFRLLDLPLASPVVTINEPHPELGWTKRRNESTHKSTSEYDVTFSINSLGLRDDPDLTLKKPAGTQRVLVVGDSFVLGYTVERQDLFVDLLEAALNADGGGPVEVLNGGTEGYSTDQELVWLRTEGLELDPDVVVLCFYQNDVYWNGQRDYAGKAKPRFAAAGNATTPEPLAGEPAAETGWFARHTALGGLWHRLTERVPDLWFPGPGGKAMPCDEAVVLASAPSSLALEDCWARTAACLRGFRDTSAQAWAKLLFVAIPGREQIQPDSAKAFLERYDLSAEQVDFARPATRALSLARQAGLETLDPAPALRQAARHEPLYFERDWHLNAAGNRVLARALHEKLRTPELLGGTPRAATAAASAPPSRMPIWPFVVAVLWLLLSVLFARSYRDEKPLLAFAKVGALVAAVVAIVLGVNLLLRLLGPGLGSLVFGLLLLALLGYLLYKALPNLGTIFEVYLSFVRRGHWYMIPLLVAMLTIGSLLVVASSSPFVAPFIYTLF